LEKDGLEVVKSRAVGTNDKVDQFIHDFLFAHDVHVEVASNPNSWRRHGVHDPFTPAHRIGSRGCAERMLREIYEPFGLPIVL
jgi:UDPglucose 6-dehydrogenase